MTSSFARPAVRFDDLAQFLLAFGKGNVDHALAVAHALQTELQSQRGFSRTADTLDHIQAFAGQTAPEHGIQALDTGGCTRQLVSVIHVSVSPGHSQYGNSRDLGRS